MRLWPTVPCSGCGIHIAWRFTPKGAKLPLDPDPVPTGNVVINRSGIAVVLDRERLKKLEAREDRDRWPLYVSHFATCVNSDRFRKKAPPRSAP